LLLRSAGANEDITMQRVRTISISAWSVAFAIGFWLFGFKLGAALLSLAFLRFQASESWKISLLYGLGAYFFFLVGFETALGSPLPVGMIAASLGLQSFERYLVNFILDLVLRHC
jgi:hypothetical protein